jgi:hypothetical protein
MMELTSVLNKVIQFKHRFLLQRYRIRIKYGSTAANPWEKLYVSPSSITRSYSYGYDSAEEYFRKGGYWTTDPKHRLDPLKNAGEIRGGRWDQNTLEFRNLPKPLGMKEHLYQNIPWPRTKLFTYYKSILDRGIDVDGCSSVSELKERYKNVDLLCQKIKQEGYLSRSKICDSGSFKCIMNEVKVCIGRNGEIIFFGGGWHRLSAAKIYSVDEIPVLVLLRHRRWQDIREKFHRMNDIKEIGPELERYIGHPDLNDLISDK